MITIHMTNSEYETMFNEPSATEEALHVCVEKVRAYAEGLRIWGSPQSPAQIATDILYLIGEK